MKNMCEFGGACVQSKSSQMNKLFFSFGLLFQCKDKSGFIFIIYYISSRHIHLHSVENMSVTGLSLNYASHFLFALL